MNAPVRDIQSDNGAAVLWSPGKLCSLWDIMKAFHASSFLSMISLLERSKPDYDTWFVRFRSLDKSQRAIAEAVLKLESTCAQLGLEASLATIQLCKRKLEWEKSREHRFTMYDYEKFASELKGRLEDELRNRECFALTVSESEQFKNPLKGWESVVSRFKEYASGEGHLAELPLNRKS